MIITSENFAQICIFVFRNHLATNDLVLFLKVFENSTKIYCTRLNRWLFLLHHYFLKYESPLLQLANLNKSAALKVNLTNGPVIENKRSFTSISFREGLRYIIFVSLNISMLKRLLSWPTSDLSEHFTYILPFLIFVYILCSLVFFF